MSRAIEPHLQSMGRDVEMNELPVLMNGDGICFMANGEFYALWKEWITRAGRTFSRGKNYISPNYVTINSQGFLWPGGSSFKQLPAFSTGLLLEHAETGKVTAMRSGIRQQPEASKWTEVLRSAHDPVRASNRLLCTMQGIRSRP